MDQYWLPEMRQYLFKRTFSHYCPFRVFLRFLQSVDIFLPHAPADPVGLHWRENKSRASKIQTDHGPRLERSQSAVSRDAATRDPSSVRKSLGRMRERESV